MTGNIAFDCCCVHQHMLLDPDALEAASLVPVHLSHLCPGNPFPLELLSPNSRPQMVVFLFFHVPVACVHYVAACLHVPPNPPWSPSPSRIPAGPEFPLPMSPKIRPYMVVFLHEGMLPGMPPCPSLIPPSPKSPACPLKVDPKWLFFPHKGMFRSIWAQVSRGSGRMKARYPPTWVSLGPRCQNPWQRTRQKASRVDRAWAPMETVEAWEQVPLRSWQNLLGRICFFVLTAISCNLQ